MPAQKDFKWRKEDALAIAGVLLLALGIFLMFVWNGYGDDAARAEIYQHGQKIMEVDLSQEQTFVIEGTYHNEIVVKDGKISVSQSNCPGEDCVHSGWKCRAGESIICLPNEMEIRIVGDGEDEIDFVTGR